jgi:hypothetical protein
MKKRIKKLVLSRESLRVLQEDALAEAPGAGTTTAFGATNCTPCQTWENVPLCRPS